MGFILNNNMVNLLMIIKEIICFLHFSHTQGVKDFHFSLPPNLFFFPNLI